jgi:hypothetical protein
MSTQLTIEYELRGADLLPLTSSILRFKDCDLVDDLRRSVVNDNSKVYLRGYDHSLLDVYLPNSESKMMEDRSQALRPRVNLQGLGDNLIVVARSLPESFRDRENALDRFQRLLEPRLEIDSRVINLIKRRDRLLRRVEVACRNEQDALDVYQDARRTFGTSTKNNIIAIHGSDLKINREFEISQESSSVFYIAWAAGVPCILKFPESASIAHL